MESTFILKPEELNSDFIESIKKIFSNARELRISINTSEDFGLLKKETPEEYMDRLTKVIEEVERGENLVKYKESDLDDIVLSSL